MRNIDWGILCELNRWDRFPPLHFERKGVKQINPSIRERWRDLTPPTV